MSDNFLRLIPTRPDFVPSSQSQRAAREHLARLLPSAEAVTAAADAHIRFVDPGANMEAVHCSRCRSELDLDWWQEAMSIADEAHFEDLSVAVPCCGAAANLNDLHYTWPAGFAKFLLEARNPSESNLDAKAVQELESILGCSLRIITAHY